MRVAILTSEYPPSHIGGIGPFCKDLAEALGQRGIEVLVIAGRPEKLPMRVRAEDENNVEILWVSRGMFAPKHFWFQIRNNSLIQREIANCDIVHGQDFAAYPALGICKKNDLGIPWLVTFHTNPIAELRWSIQSNMGRGFSLVDFITYTAGFPVWDLAVRSHARNASALVCNSNSLRAELVETYRIHRDMKIIHTCVNTRKLRTSLSRNHVNSTSRPRLSYAGRLYYRKGPMQLLRVARHLREELGVTNFDLRIFGEGPLEGVMRSYISRYGLQENVQLCGRVPLEALLGELASSDVFCLPSLYETCCVVLIEAMALGKPVVAFNFPFNREIMGEELIALFASDMLDFARKVAYLLKHDDERRKFGAVLYDRALNFDSSNIAADYQTAYENLVR